MIVIKTTLPFVVVTLAMISVLLLGLSVSKEDWMVEEIEVKLKPVSEWIEANPTVALKIANMMNGYMDDVINKMKVAMGNGLSDKIGTTSSSSDSDEKSTQQFTGERVKEILRTFTDGSIFIHGLYDFDKLCSRIKLDGLKTPIRWLNSPSIQFCIDNDVYFNPTKYDLPESLKTIQDKGLKGLQNGYITILIGVSLASIGLIIAVAKIPCVNIKCKTSLLFISMVLFIMAGICTGCALTVVRSDFTFKRDFDRMIDIYKQQTDLTNNIRRENSESYKADTAALVMKMVHKYIHWEEYLGSPAILCGISIAALFISALLSLLEYCLTKNNDVNYDNFALA